VWRHRTCTDWHVGRDLNLIRRNVWAQVALISAGAVIAVGAETDSCTRDLPGYRNPEANAFSMFQHYNTRRYY